MSDPYTEEEDLRHEAARQYAILTEDPDFMGVGEMMQGAEIESMLPPAEADGAEGAHWDDVLDRDAFDKAQRKIHDLIDCAADVSKWAVDLGADSLESSKSCITVNGDDKPIARLHFAFHPDVAAGMRIALVEGIGSALSAANPDWGTEETRA